MEINRLYRYNGTATNTGDNAVSVTAALRDLYGQMESSNKAAHPLLFLMVDIISLHHPSTIPQSLTLITDTTKGLSSIRPARTGWSLYATRCGGVLVPTPYYSVQEGATGSRNRWLIKHSRCHRVFLLKLLWRSG